MDNHNLKFVNDQVEGWTPIEFAIAFTRKLRSMKVVSHPPSLRTAMSIPRFLTARYCRIRILTPADYIQAAVLNTLYEDQLIAEQVARDLIFPKKKTEPKKETEPKPESVVKDSALSILDDLASLNIDFENLDDLSSVEELIGTSEDEAMKAFDLFENLYHSKLETERSLAQLCSMFGGPAEMSASGINSIFQIKTYLQEMLRAEIGDLSPQHIYHACCSGFSEMMQQEAKQPWELAGALAGSNNNEALQSHLDDLLESASCRDLGKTLQFLKPYQMQKIQDFSHQLKDKPENLSDFAEITNGMDEWFEPSHELIEKSVKENMQRSLTAANWIDQNFDMHMSEKVFETWADNLKKIPDLDLLSDFIVNCKSWIDLANKAYKNYIKKNHQISKTIETASKLQKSDINSAKKIASDLSSETIISVDQKEQFLPVLDEFIEHKIFPSKTEKIVKAGIKLGVNPEEIYDRLGDSIEQLKQMIEDNATDAVERYKMLTEKISKIDSDLFEKMTKMAVKNKNPEAMASMLAIDLGKASSYASNDFVMESLCYKGIGYGTNLLKQWFNSRSLLNQGIKNQVKAMASEALIELAFDWINKGSGSCESGLIPQNNARPFLSGDDIELLDIESTLDSIISSGKSLDSITDEDLFVHDTSKGRAAMGVLIDISGSMGGYELAMCSISVVMLLGKLRSEEIALALFESDTHVVKRFHDATDMDDVIDKVLDLQANGGTRVDAALKWIHEEFESVTDAEYRILFLLSDFCFFERPEELKPNCQLIADSGVKFLGASHGISNTDSAQTFLDIIGGQVIKLKSISTLPNILIEALEQINEGN